MHLCKPQVKRCFVAPGFDPPLSAMELKWDGDGPGVSEKTWHLPGGITLRGRAPTRFGVHIVRVDEDGYRLSLVWDRVCFRWDGLTRVQIMASSIAHVLESLGTDLWRLLNQPIAEQALAA